MAEIDYAGYINSITGYDVSIDDDDLIAAIAAGELQHLLNTTNQTKLPDGLAYVLRDLVAAKFLTIKKAAVLGSDNLNVAKQITEGDVSITLGGSTDEDRLNSLISALSEERDVRCFRKLAW